MMKRGALIVFEGCDRSGKSTQCQKLMQWFKQNDKDAHLMRFPDRSTVIGGLIGKYLECNTEIEDHAIHLLFSANRWEMLSIMKKMLFEGKNIVIDRYAFSGVAFTGAKKGMEFNWCQQSDSGLPKPDLVIFLDIDPELAQNRGEYGAERYEKLAFQNQVRSNYMKLKDETWKVIDATKSQEEVHIDVCNIVQASINGILPDSPLEKLWV